MNPRSGRGLQTLFLPIWRKLILLLSVLTVSGAQAEILLGLGAPLSGQHAWPGEQVRIGAEVALQKINDEGGVLGQQVRLIPGDDAANAEQAVAVARKFVSDGVTAVIGHWASGTTIAASAVYEQAGVLMISPASTNPKVTDSGRRNVFRVCGRDDRQGVLAGDYLADAFGDGKIAIIHDGTAYGEGLAAVTRKRLVTRGIKESFTDEYKPGEVDYSPLISTMKSENVDVVFVGGYAAEISLMIREARDQQLASQFVSGDGLSTSDFWLAAGAAGEGTLFTFFKDPRRDPRNKDLVESFREQGVEPDGYTLYSYAAVQVWAQAASRAGSFELSNVVEAMHSSEFDTVLGKIAFDEKGDIKGPGFSWYVWSDGEYKAL